MKNKFRPFAFFTGKQFRKIGLGGGIKFQVAESFTEMGSISRWYIDLRVRYLLGGKAEYLKEGALRNNNGTLSYDISNSRTDLFTAGIGFVVRF